MTDDAMKDVFVMFLDREPWPIVTLALAEAFDEVLDECENHWLQTDQAHACKHAAELIRQAAAHLAAEGV